MYEELVKRLREKAGRFDYDGWVDTAAIMEEAADAIDDLIRDLNSAGQTIADLTIEKAVRGETRWIPVTERLPKGADTSGEICENVNLLLDDGLVTCGWMNGITDKVYYLNVRDDYIQKTPISRVTHWQPLPEPPKEET